MEHTSNAKILIADENAAQRTQLRESLTRAGIPECGGGSKRG